MSSPMGTNHHSSEVNDKTARLGVIGLFEVRMWHLIKTGQLIFVPGVVLKM